MEMIIQFDEMFAEKLLNITYSPDTIQVPKKSPIYKRVLEPDQIPHTQSMAAERALTNVQTVKRSYPMLKSRLKYSTAEFQSNQQFWLQLDIIS